QLKLIAREEKLKVEEKAFFAIARGGEGSMRDVLSLLDQLISFSDGKIRGEDVNAVLGMVDEETFFALVEAMIKEDVLSGIRLIDTVIGQGKDLRLFSTNLIEHFRNMMMYKVGGEAIELIDLPKESLGRLKNQSGHFNMQEIEEAINILSRMAEALKWTESGRIPLELAIIKLTKAKTVPAVSETVSEEKKLSRQEQQSLASGMITASSSSRKDDGGSLSLEKVKEAWPRVLERVKEKKITAEAYLREGEPVKASEKMLTVAFPAEFNFHKESVERNETRRVIEEVLRNIFQHDLMIHPILERSPTPGRRRTAPVEAQGGEDKLTGLLDKEPIVKIALDVFGARIVEVKKK
ncbi:hypothetical protein LR003_01130, partial [candidate division NPL-UPA2 bacterium]|nr:hypothetical protein [candidate division NPL-UPA2 bacterium]